MVMRAKTFSTMVKIRRMNSPRRLKRRRLRPKGWYYAKSTRFVFNNVFDRHITELALFFKSRTVLGRKFKLTMRFN